MRRNEITRGELLALAERELRPDIIRWLMESGESVYAERDRKANLPYPTPAGDLVPGGIYDLRVKVRNGKIQWMRKVRILPNYEGIDGRSRFHSVTVGTTRGSQRIALLDVVEAVVASLPAEPVKGL